MINPPRHDLGGGEDQKSCVYDWQSDKLDRATIHTRHRALDGDKLEALIPFASDTTPVITGQLRFVVFAWNGS